MSMESITQQVKEEISKLTQVLRLLEGTGVKQTRAQLQANSPRRNVSASARKRMSLAQKARWAKRAANVKAGTAKPKRKMSAAGRERIAAAQRARWANVKAQQKKG
ncbi:MAG: hypothetical protein ACLPLR_17135 [Terriglobales bacterium]